MKDSPVVALIKERLLESLPCDGIGILNSQYHEKDGVGEAMAILRIIGDGSSNYFLFASANSKKDGDEVIFSNVVIEKYTKTSIITNDNILNDVSSKNKSIEKWEVEKISKGL